MAPGGYIEAFPPATGIEEMLVPGVCEARELAEPCSALGGYNRPELEPRIRLVCEYGAYPAGVVELPCTC